MIQNAWFKLKKSVVAIFPFIPARQEANHHEIEPHSSSELNIATVITLNIPSGVNSVLMQAIGQNIRYTISPNSNPDRNSGFRLTAGNDPIAIPIADGFTVLRVTAEDPGAVLQFQFGINF